MDYCFNLFLVVKYKDFYKKLTCIKVVLMNLLEMKLEDKSSEDSLPFP